MTSEGGRGTLTIRDVKEGDQGAYTCEAMNARGMVFGIPDGVLELVPQRGTTDGLEGAGCGLEWGPPVEEGAGYSPLPCRPAGPCPDGHFYLEHSASCLPCFCFGVTNVCQSSRRFRDQIRLRFDQPNDFKGALAGGQALCWAGARHRAPAGLEGGRVGEQRAQGARSREGPRVAGEMPSPVRRAFQEGNIFWKSQIHT